MSGKGSTPRPFSVDRKTFEDNWDRIFKNKNLKDDMDELSNTFMAERQESAWTEKYSNIQGET